MSWMWGVLAGIVVGFVATGGPWIVADIGRTRRRIKAMDRLLNGTQPMADGI